MALSYGNVVNDSSEGDGGDGFPWSGPGPAGDDDLSVALDTLYEILSKRRCRLVLSHLEAASVDVVELDDIVDHVVEREASPGAAAPANADADADAADHRRRVATTLHHRHLPRLSVTPLLDYDGRSKTVRYRGDDRVAAYLDAFRFEDEI